MSGIDFGALLPDLEAAFVEVAGTALGLPSVSRVELPAERPVFHGAYLALVSPQGAVQIGLAAEEAGCQRLAKGLVGMGESDPDLAAPEMADAFCEIVNIVAGGFKGRVRERLGSLTMGLPVFFHGPAQQTGHTAIDLLGVRAGAVTAALIILHPRTGGEG
jgi:hypothetical protein